MNTKPEPATTNPEPVTQASAPEPAIFYPQRPTDVPRRLRGKIASLPKDQRDTINKLLLDGATYAVVIQRMAEHGVSLNPENVSNWYQSGFQDYLAHLERLDNQRARYEAATDLLQNIDVSKIPEAGLQTAAAQIYDLLDRFNLPDIAASLANEPDKYIRLVNSLSRLTREALAIQKHADARARAALRQLDRKRKLDESENRTIVRCVDEIFGFPPEPDPDQPDDTPAPPPPAAETDNVTPENLPPDNPAPDSLPPDNPAPDNPTPDNPTPDNPTPDNLAPPNPTPENPSRENLPPDTLTPDDLIALIT